MVKLTELAKSAQGSASPKEKKHILRRQGINFRNPNIIKADAIPPPSRASTPYKELLRKIDKGQALVLTDMEVSLETAAAAVRRLKRLPEFEDFTVTRRTVEGQKRLYIVHEDNTPEVK